MGASTILPSQTFQFRSLEFVTDQLGALCLHEEEASLAATEEPVPPPKPRLMMASNPAVEDINMVLFSLANVSRQLAGGPPLPTPRSFSE